MVVSAVVDTNVWVSAFLTPHGFPARLSDAGKAGRFAVVSSLPLLAERLEVLCRPRIMKVRQTTVTDAEAYVRGVAAVARLAPVAGHLRLCRDPDDDLVLETAMAGGATHVVSRDEDVTRDVVMKDQLLAKIHNHTAVVGLGYVGLPLAWRWRSPRRASPSHSTASFDKLRRGLSAGFGIDVAGRKVDALSRGAAYVRVSVAVSC